MSECRHILPGWALSMLERLVPLRNRDFVVGDFAEIYQYIAEEDGRLAALRWYLWQLMRSLPSFLLNGVALGGSMVGSYVKVAVRNLSKRKFYASLNIGGLAIGMAVCLLILQYVVFETSYESFHEHRNHLFRVNLGAMQAEEMVSLDPYTFHAMAPLMLDAVPEVQDAARIHPSFGSATVRVLDSGNPRTSFKETTVGYVDPSFTTMFTFEPASGNPETALQTKGTAVLSRSAATRYFGEGDPIGRTIDVRGWVEGEYSVGAVVEDVPLNTHVRFDVMIPMEDLLTNESGQYAETNGWSWTNFITYVQLTPAADPETVAIKIADVVQEAKTKAGRTDNEKTVVDLQPISRIHLFSNFADMFSASAAYKTVLFLSIIGLLVLTIAWINYINLTTARALERAKEVGIRKASGARRGQILSQFLVESVLVNAVALSVAVAAAKFALPIMNRLVGTSIPETIWSSPAMWLGLVVVFGLGALLASAYPSLVISSFQPIGALTGRFGQGVSGSRLRTGLVVFQFALSVGLLAGVYIVYEQVQYLRGIELGFDIERTLVVEAPSIIDDQEAYQSNRQIFKTRGLALAGVTGVATSTSIPGNGYNLGTTFRKESDPETDATPVRVVWVNETFVTTYGFTILAGRDFIPDSEVDRELGVLVNEETVKVLGFESNQDAIGGRLVFGRSSPAEILGVLQDFNWMSAKNERESVVFSYTSGGHWFSFKTTTGDVSTTISQLSVAFAELFPGNTFDYFFADEEFNQLFRDEARLQTLVSIFAVLALLVAALGLIGLSALTSSQRTKEISIRKVLGASDLGIARLLSGRFALLVLAGVILSVPAVYFVADGWLDGFPSRIALTIEQFLFPGIAVLLIALLASGYHVVRAAGANPVDGIRGE